MLAFSYSAAFGRDAETTEALRLITETAGQICQTSPLEQSNTGTELSGEAKAKVNGLVGRIADLSISGEGASQSEHSAGVLQKDLITAIQIGNNCKQHVFDTLVRILLKEHSNNATPGVADADNALETSVDFSVPNSEQYCIRLKKIIDSAKKRFNTIIGKKVDFPPETFKPKIELPNMEWCRLNTLTPGKKATIYYGCRVFQEEKSGNIAKAKFSAYKKVTADCLGKDWITNETQEMRPRPEKTTSFRRESEDPNIELRSRETDDGADMVIYVDQP